MANHDLQPINSTKDEVVAIIRVFHVKPPAPKVGSMANAPVEGKRVTEELLDVTVRGATLEEVQVKARAALDLA